VATTWNLELRGCFQPAITTLEVEFHPCAPDALPSVYAAWTDGTNWLDWDGSQVGWIELDGVTFYPPLDAI
jgi:hypothetical protein